MGHNAHHTDGGGPGRSVRAAFALALALRLIHLWSVWDTPLLSNFVPDFEPYLFYAEKMLAGEFFLRLPLVMSPGYSILLAPFVALGLGAHQLVAFQAVLDAASAGLCAWLAWRAFGRAAGWIAGLAYALCGPVVFYSLLPLGDGPALFCLLAGTALWLRAASPGGHDRAAWLAGALLGFGCLLRPNLAPALGLAGLAMLAASARGRVRFGASWRVAAAAALVLLPLAAHNHAAQGSWSPFGSQGGFTFYSGNHAGATGVGDHDQDITNQPFNVVVESRDLVSAAQGREVSFAEASSWWFGRGLDFWAEHPGRALALTGRKALMILGDRAESVSMNFRLSARFSPVLAGLGWFPMGVFLALGLAGALCAGGRGPDTAMLRAGYFGLFATVALFCVTERYRLVLAPYSFIFAAGMLVRLADWAGRGAVRRALPAAALCLGLLVLAHLPPGWLAGPGPDRDAGYLRRLALYYRHMGDEGRAQALMREAEGLPGPAPEPWTGDATLSAEPSPSSE